MIKQTILLCIGLLCQPLDVLAETKNERPNIVFVLFDDMGYGQPPSYRADSLFKTPNIDRLARQGMRFTDAHSAAANCTPTREWVDSGVAVGAGTDTPVTDFDPWLNIFGFMTRETDVAGVLGPEHRITAAEALRMYTTGSAKILGAGNVVGSLEPGKLADFICLDRDPLSAAPDEVRATRVLRTVVGGRAVHSTG